MSNQLAAMKEQGIRIWHIDCDEMTVTFSNGITLPIQSFLAPDKETEVIDPVDGGYAAFGNDEVGYGYYPVILITEEEYQEELELKQLALQVLGNEAPQ